MSRLRGILRERAYLQARERWLVRHVRQQQATGKGLLEWGLLRATSREALVESELDILCDDLDANCRALAVALGLWAEPWPGGESAPRLTVAPYQGRTKWVLRCGFITLAEFSHLRGFTQTIAGCRYVGSIPGLDALPEQPQAMDAIRCVWAALEGQ